MLETFAVIVGFFECGRKSRQKTLAFSSVLEKSVIFAENFEYERKY